MTKQEMMTIVQTQLALDLNCTPDDLNGEKDNFIFIEMQDNPGRRPFPRDDQPFEMLTMGGAVVVSAQAELLGILKSKLSGANRDEAFSMPYVYGHSLYYLPDINRIEHTNPPSGFTYEIIERTDIPKLYQFEEFKNAIQFDVNHPRPDVLVTLAKKDNRIVAMAGASSDCEKMWQIGIDVLPEYRSHGLASHLVNWLTHEILNRGYVPYYGTASSNVASQRVAHRAGYFPAWMCAYKTFLKPTLHQPLRAVT